MVDDDSRLLDVLGRALVQQEEPPPQRVQALLADIGTERLPPRMRRPTLGWLAAGVSVAAAVAVLLLLALPALLSPGGSAQEAAASTREAVARLRTALAAGDPVAVAEADADLLRIAGRLPPREAQQLRDDAVSAHTKAVVFLRDNPAPVEFVPRPVDPDAPPGARQPAPPAVDAPPRAVTPPTSESVVGPGNAAPVAPAVAIGAVTAELDRSFRVDFTTTGFTPDSSRAPGTYAVRFSFDGGQAPAVWTGPSPWVFPLGDGLLYRQVCAEVVDHTGASVPSSGGCRPIA